MVQLAEKSVNNIKKYFNFFDNTFSNIIKEVCENYWKISPDVRLFSLEKNTKNFFSGNEYFVTQAQAQNIAYFIRLSDTVCEYFLSTTLGENNSRYFQFSKITELEGTIIFKYNQKIFSKMKEFFISKKEISKAIDKEENFENCLHLGFLVHDPANHYETGKIFLSIPEKLLNLPELTPEEGTIDTTKFKKAKTPVDIFVGKTRLSIDDINNIEEEDIVVLEQSNIKKMKVVEPTEIEFNVNPDPRLFIKDDEDDIETQENITVSTKDIWDNVQVDVCAKFPKVKLSLGELREMTKGVVMELDDVYDNEIVLEVENKNVAKGELVIVGDKYGVKVTEIFEQTEEPEENIKKQNNDDFDVKDFEIEE